MKRKHFQKGTKDGRKKDRDLKITNMKSTLLFSVQVVWIGTAGFEQH